MRTPGGTAWAGRGILGRGMVTRGGLRGRGAAGCRRGRRRRRGTGGMGTTGTGGLGAGETGDLMWTRTSPVTETVTAGGAGMIGRGMIGRGMIGRGMKDGGGMIGRGGMRGSTGGRGAGAGRPLGTIDGRADRVVTDGRLRRRVVVLVVPFTTIRCMRCSEPWNGRDEGGSRKTEGGGRGRGGNGVQKGCLGCMAFTILIPTGSGVVERSFIFPSSIHGEKRGCFFGLKVN